jgi:hypothetical protein
MSLPSLNLHFDKKTSSSVSNTNDNSSKNIINLTLYHPQSQTPKPIDEDLQSNFDKKTSISPYPENVKNPLSRELDQPEPYSSPTYQLVEVEFKNQLLSFTLDLLLNDLDLIKNIAERNNKVIFKIEQLKQLIAILYLNREDRNKYEDLIEIETEEIVVNNCFCTSCNNPFYQKIKSIIINKSVNFLLTPYSTNLLSVFKVSLEHVLKEQK